MTPDRLKILLVSQLPPSPPRCGAQARMHGLMTQLARDHDLTTVTLADAEFDRDECERALRGYCEEAFVLPNPNGANGFYKRALQVRSLASTKSFEWHRYSAKALQGTLDALLARRHFDVVNVEFPYLAHYRFRKPGGERIPHTIDAHDIVHDLQRQLVGSSLSLDRRLYAAANWRKIRWQEVSAFRAADGIAACSEQDRNRILGDAPHARTVVIPNAADVEHFQPRPSDPSPDGQTILFFGLLSTFPNLDGISFFMREIWPRIASARPHARLKIIGSNPPAAIREFASARVEVTGFVEDLRPHLASAAAIVVPLRMGSGTRLKILETMAMGRAIVSTHLGAEGIEVRHEREILLADGPDAFGDQVIRLLDSPELGRSLGSAARELAVGRYSWTSAAARLASFYREVIENRIAGHPRRSPATSMVSA